MAEFTSDHRPVFYGHWYIIISHRTIKLAAAGQSVARDRRADLVDCPFAAPYSACDAGSIWKWERRDAGPTSTSLTIWVWQKVWIAVSATTGDKEKHKKIKNFDAI